jgi:hypothetical protein
MMAELIDFPDCPASFDELPEPGDPYRAFGPPADQPHLTLFFALPDGSMQGFKYPALERISYDPADSPDGPERISMMFRLMQPAEVLIEGRNLFDLCYYLGEHRTHWLRMIADGQMVHAPDMPVITRVVIQPND